MSTISRSVVLVNPDVPEAKKLRSWYANIRYSTLLFPCYGIYIIVIILCCMVRRYEFEGKDAAMDALGSGSSPISNNGIRSVYSDRVPLSHITSNQSLGDMKVFGS